MNDRGQLLDLDDPVDFFQICFWTEFPPWNRCPVDARGNSPVSPYLYTSLLQMCYEKKCLKKPKLNALSSAFVVVAAASQSQHSRVPGPFCADFYNGGGATFQKVMANYCVINFPENLTQQTKAGAHSHFLWKRMRTKTNTQCPRIPPNS